MDRGPQGPPWRVEKGAAAEARERLAEQRRALPWVKVDKDYVFDGPDGKVIARRPVQGAPASSWCSM